MSPLAWEAVWARFDPECTGFIDPHHLRHLVTRLDQPLGLKKPGGEGATASMDLLEKELEEGHEALSETEDKLAMAVVQGLELLDWDGKVTHMLLI